MEYRQAINSERVRDTFLELIRINAPSFGEREIGAALIGKLERAGCRVAVQEYGRSFNLVAFKPGTRGDSPAFLLSGHMDTVEPTEGIVFSLDNGVIRSAGPTILGADDKCALAEIIEAVTALDECRIPHGDIEIVFTSGEEKGLAGAKHLDFGMLRSRHGLVLDSGGPVGNLVVAAPTHVTYTMKITGKAAHAGIEPERGISAIRVAANILKEIPDGRIDAATTANVGFIQGGRATNVVPREVMVHGEVRSHDGGCLEDTKESIFKAARRIASASGAGIEISEVREYQAFRIEEQDPFLQFLLGVYGACGIEPSRVASGGGSDANVFNEKGIRAVNISTGMQRVHTNEEFIAVEDLCRGALVVLTAVAGFPAFAGAGAVGP